MTSSAAETSSGASTRRRSRFLVARCALDCVYLLLSPFAVAGFLLISRFFTRRKYRGNWLHKFGFVPRRRGTRPEMWIHAVSVGEVGVAAQLVGVLEDAFPQWDFCVSVSTTTGFEIARRRLDPRRVFYAPIDFGPCLSLAFRRRRPALILLVELELWPGFLLTAAAHGVFVGVVNGRLSERSARRYLQVGPLARGLFALPTAISVQSDEYRERFLRLGVDPGRIETLGNLKHDVEPSPSAADGEPLRASLGWNRGQQLVIVAGCTHPGEETALARLYEQWRADLPGVRLVLAPRHVERLQVANEVENWGLATSAVRYSNIVEALQRGSVEAVGTGVLVVDVLGVLDIFYYLADVVIIGGTFVPHGGHNMLEAARIGRPVVLGPSTGNFAAERDCLAAADAVIQVPDLDHLDGAIRRLLSAPAEREALGQRALETCRKLRGSTSRHIEWLRGQMQLFFGTAG